MFSVIPSEAELEACWEEARQATDDGGRNVVRESAVDLEMNLLKEAKRFIVVDEIHHPAAWPRDDSYDHVAYNTENPATMLAALEKTFSQSSHPDGETRKIPRGRLYQFQAIPTANVVDDIKTSLT